MEEKSVKLKQSKHLNSEKHRRIFMVHWPLKRSERERSDVSSLSVFSYEGRADFHFEFNSETK